MRSSSAPIEGIQVGCPGPIVVAEARDGRRGDLDAAARRRQRVGVRVRPKSSKDTAVIGRGRKRELATPPELGEIRRVPSLRGERRAGRRIEMLEPLARRPPFRERLARPEMAGKIGEDREIVARLSGRLREAAHHDEKRVGRGRSDILALERHRGR